MVQLLIDNYRDSPDPLRARLDKWTDVLDREAARIDGPKGKIYMAEVCNSAGWTMMDECKHRNFGRNYLLISVWLYGNALMYCDEAPQTESVINARQFATDSIAGMVKEFDITDEEVNQLNGRVFLKIER